MNGTHRLFHISSNHWRILYVEAGSSVCMICCYWGDRKGACTFTLNFVGFATQKRVEEVAGVATNFKTSKQGFWDHMLFPKNNRKQTMYDFIRNNSPVKPVHRDNVS